MAVYVSNRMANDSLILLSKEDDGMSCGWHEQRVTVVAKELKRPVLTSRLSGGFQFDCEAYALNIGVSSYSPWGESVTCLRLQQPDHSNSIILAQLLTSFRAFSVHYYVCISLRHYDVGWRVMLIRECYLAKHLHH